MRQNFSLAMGKVIIKSEAVRTMLDYRQIELNHKEAGGLLIGRFPTQGNHRVIESVTTPILTDRRSRTTFYRSCWHNLKLRRAWKKSNNTLTLIGTWHTHPEPIPRPSQTDLQDWRKVLAKARYEGSDLIFLIVGTAKTTAWLAHKTGACIQLKEIE